MKNLSLKPEKNNLGNKEIEYEQIHHFLRYLLDYRAKIFNYAIAFNIALLTIVIQYLRPNIYFGKLILSILGLGITLIFLLAEKRTIRIFYEYLTYAKWIEEKLGFGVLTYIRDKVEHSRISLRKCFKALYGLLAILWFSQIVELVFNWISNNG